MSDVFYNLITWECFKALIKEVLHIDFVKIDDFFKEETTWFALEEYKDLSDLEILNCLASLRDFEGILYIVSDASYQKNLGPFKVESNITNFVIHHKENFGERFLETDILIISFELNLAWVFHHEGVYAIVELS